MYIPKHFSETADLAIRRLIDENGFVTVMSFPNGELPFLNHLPVIWSSKPDEKNVLIGHMAKRNPQWMHFQDNSNCMIVVNGPHAYITPSWYKSGRDVPTWNYAVAHLVGRIELVSDFFQQVEILKSLTDFYERKNDKPWEFELPNDLLDSTALTSAIISFKFHIEKIEGKFKLSQNRSDMDRKGIIEGLGQRADQGSHAIQALMKEAEQKK